MTYRLERAYAVLAVFAVLALQPSLDHWGKTLLVPFCELLIVGALAAAWTLRNVHWSLALNAAIILVNCAISFAYVSEGMAWSVAHVGNAAYTAASFGATLLACLTIPERPARHAFAAAGFITSLAILYKTAMGAPPFTRWEFIGNPSQTGCFIACVLPFMVDRRPKNAIDACRNLLIVLIAVSAIWCIGTVVPWLCLAAVYCAAWCRNDKRLIPYVAALAIFAVTAYAAIQDRLVAVEHLNGSGRFVVWQIGLEHFRNAPLFTKLFGFGAGSTWLNLMQWFPATNHDWWTWYHNDWLQQLIEFGAVGLVAAVLVAVSAFRLAWRTSSRQTAALAGVCVWGAANYPARLAFTSFFCTWVVISTFKSGKIDT